MPMNNERRLELRSNPSLHLTFNSQISFRLKCDLRVERGYNLLFSYYSLADSNVPSCINESVIDITVKYASSYAAVQTFM